MQICSEKILPVDQFQQLINVLHAGGYTVVGPAIDQGAIVYGEIDHVDQLPRGWTDSQTAGVYRLERRNDEAYFGYVVGPHSWKKYLFPPRTTLAEATLTDSGWNFTTPDVEPPKFAFLGVRACELAAISIQDRVFLEGPYTDPTYAGRREQAFIIAVNCTQAAETCFCASMETGPRCRAGFDLAITELEDHFVIESGSDRGQAILHKLATETATEKHLTQAEAKRQQAVDQQIRALDAEAARDILRENLTHSHWDEVGSRCLGCTNCTMVCPTCFCSSVEEVPSLSGDHVERQRHWDSCFNLSFSYMSHGTARDSITHRYRQWLTHKLSTWHDQFGSSGCVGCGRCITWCPVGIDLVEEIQAFTADESGADS